MPVVLADDLTGAADTASQFAAVGFDTRVWLGAADAPSEVAVFDTNTRPLSGEVAAGAVAALASRLVDPRVYLKIDSTLRGNPGAEICAALGALGRSVAIVAPAFPANGRMTLGGVQYVRGERLGDVREMVGAECSIEVLDAETDDDLGRIADRVVAEGRRCLPVGSAGLAGHLARRWAAGRTVDRPRVPRAESVLFVCGSTNPVTVEQVARLRAAGGAAITSEVRPGAGLTEALSLAASRSVADARPDAIFLSGGDTARAVLSALGASGIHVFGDLMAGIPFGEVIGGELDGVTIVTKAGGFGPPDALIRVKRFLEEPR